VSNEDLKSIIRNSQYTKSRYRSGWHDGVFAGLVFCAGTVVSLILIISALRL
jgi:hypothetical protein